MNSNLFEAIISYWDKNKSVKGANSNLTTALFKYTFPSMGFQLSERSNKRIHSLDKILALDFAKEILLTQENIESLLAAQQKTFEEINIKDTNKRQQKKNLLKFIDFINTNFNIVQVEKEMSSPKVTRALVKKKLLDRSIIQKELSKKVNRNKTIKLSFDVKKYSGDIKYIQEHLNRIKLEISSNCDFLMFNDAGTKKRKQVTVDTWKKQVLRILGWQYLECNDLSKVSIYSIIKPVAINVKIEDFCCLNDYYIAKGKQEAKAKEEAKKVISFLDNFLAKYKVKTARVKTIYSVAVLNIAKFVYKDITDVDWYENYEDIPVVRRLRIYINKIPKESKRIENSLITWDTVINVLEDARRRADHLFIESVRYKPDRNKEYIETKPRQKLGLASDLQIFIALGLFTLIPPSRSRVIRELKLGSTFKHGLFTDNIFVPKDKLDNAQEAKYYIHLSPEDYKTGETYGEWLAEFPNVKFNDGKCFYDYLNRFIYGEEREYLLKRINPNNDHSYLLVKILDGNPCNEYAIYSMISNRFKYTTGQLISPHKLRTIFRTYLANSNATETELESAAFWMRHSNKTAKQTYTKQNLDEKLAPGAAIATKLNSDLLQSNT